MLLFNIIRAAITPGIQPIIVRISTIRMDPQPRSYTARGGNMIAKITRKNDMTNDYVYLYRK